MAISKLILHFDAQAKIPVEIDDVLSEIKKLVLDERIELHGVDTRETKMRGTHYRYREAPHPDGALMPERVVQVIYSTKQNEFWQRLVCCKELVHIFDMRQVRTQKQDEVIRLGRKLANGVPGKWSRSSASDPHSFFDELAKWQALAVMFPFGFRADALPLLRKGATTIERIASVVELPPEYVEYAMMDSWEPLRESILTNC